MAFFNSIINRSKRRGSEDGVFEVELRLDLLGPEDEGLKLSGEDDEGSGK